MALMSAAGVSNKELNNRPVISEVWCTPDPNQGFARETYDMKYFNSSLVCQKACKIRITVTASSNGDGGVYVYAGGSVVINFQRNTIKQTHVTKTVEVNISPGQRVYGQFYGDWASWWNLRAFII